MCVVHRHERPGPLALRDEPDQELEFSSEQTRSRGSTPQDVRGEQLARETNWNPLLARSLRRRGERRFDRRELAVALQQRRSIRRRFGRTPGRGEGCDTAKSSPIR